jgi:hypothetical protein
MTKTKAINESIAEILPVARCPCGGWTHGGCPPLPHREAGYRRSQALIDLSSQKLGIPSLIYQGGCWEAYIRTPPTAKTEKPLNAREQDRADSSKILIDIGGLKSNLRTHAENAGVSSTRLATLILSAGIRRMTSGGSMVAPAEIIDDDVPEPKSEMLHAKITARRSCSHCRETYKIHVELSEMRPSLSRTIARDLSDLITDEMDDTGWKSGVCPSCSVDHGEEISLQDLAEYRADQEN